jgi:AI-2 transport protein TqsA
MNENKELKLIASCLLIITGILLAAALSFTSSIMIPFVLAVFLSYLISPLVHLFYFRLNAPYSVAVFVSILTGIGIIALISMLFNTSFQSMLENAHLYRDRVVSMVEEGSLFLEGKGVPVNPDAITGAVRELPILNMIRGALATVLTLLSNSFLIIIFVSFLILGRNPNRQKTGVYQEVDSRIQKFIVTKIATSAVTGILVGTILTIFGLELALVFGVLAFLLNFIPTIGSVVASLLPLPIAMIQFSNPLTIGLIILIPGMIQFMIGNVIEPKVMGKGLDLHPVTVLLNLMLWGLIWGVPGMFLATPIIAVMKIMLARFEKTRPVAEILAGRLPEEALPQEEPAEAQQPAEAQP